MTDLSSTIDLATATDLYLQRIGEADPYAALDLVQGLLDDGVPAERLLLGVIAPAQRRVGELWATGEWSVAREHGATAVSEQVVGAIGARVRPRQLYGRVVVACVDGEYHQLAARLLAEVLRLRGLRVDFLGTNVPGPHLIAHLHRTGPDAVALSCTMPTGLPRAHATLNACRTAGVPVLAGGSGFGMDGRFARKLGADGWAPTADAAADLLRSGLLPSFPPPADELPHLADQEYARLVQDRTGLIDRTMRALTTTYPPAAAYDERQREATIEDLGHIADHLATALYLDDVALFTDFVTYTCVLLAARHVPAVAVSVGLRLMRKELPELPRAQHLLTEGIHTTATLP
ncbi:B12-binding domain-containing protein [Sphaerisporangium melleum]|uniref:cobalamin B12-binding domain-containing protein n=1 Tax=Sphaerisporangium melleum TaxID=321316 RepID=UPI00194F5DFE|nr:cobalamin-dependent protein [Sphaerisporangium melleum]